MKYLGVDFGLRRIGLALSEGNISSPFKTIQVTNFKNGIEQVMEIINKEKFDKVIVGLPEGKMGQNVKGFINALIRKGINVEAADETLTSKKALEQAIESNLPQKKRQFNDSIAASIILQDYLDSQ